MTTQNHPEENNIEFTPEEVLPDQGQDVPEQIETTAENWQQELENLNEKNLRLQAELENFRKRTQKEAEQARKYQGIHLIRDLLPVIDNLQRAVAAAEAAEQVSDLVQGIQMVSHQLLDVLARYDVKPIPAVGEPFDPNLHEAIQQMPTEDVPANFVALEVECGYLLHDRVIRPSKVIVSSGPAAG